MKNNKILPLNICFCRYLEIPPVSDKEIKNIIRYKLSAYYPGSIDDLIIDYLKMGKMYAVFYMSRKKFNFLKKQFPEVQFFSSYHLFNFSVSDLEIKQYAHIDDRIEIVTKSDSLSFELNSLPYDFNTLSRLIDRGYSEVENYSPLTKTSIFKRNKKNNYFLQIGILMLLIFAVPQVSGYFQYKSDSQYLEVIEKELNLTLDEKSKKIFSLTELDFLKTEYKFLMENQPISPFRFFTELSFLLERETTIDSLVLKNNSFQLNARGYKPLNKMDGFQQSRQFHSVIPHQVQTIVGSEKEKFSLTGFYKYE